MKEKNEELFLLSLASRINGEKAKELYGKEVLNPEQYIKLCEFMKLDEADISGQIKQLVESIKSYQLEQETKAQERAAIAADNAQKRKQQLNKQKQNIGAAATLTPEKKAKARKFGILVTIGLVLLLIVGLVLNYAFTNIIGFTDVDLADYVVVNYETNNQKDTPWLYGNWDFYSEGGYYTDSINSLVESGIYTEEEATALMPDEMSIKVKDVVYDYELSTSNELVNGDQFEATIMYDQELAKEYKLNVINNKFAFIMRGLLEPVEENDITNDLLTQIEFTEEDAIAEAKDDSWRPEDYNFEVESTHYFLVTDYDEYDETETSYIEKVYVIKKTDAEDSEDVNYVSKGLEVYVKKTDTDISLGDYVYGLNSYKSYNGDLSEVLDFYESYQLEAVEIGGDI